MTISQINHRIRKLESGRQQDAEGDWALLYEYDPDRGSGRALNPEEQVKHSNPPNTVIYLPKRPVFEE